MGAPDSASPARLPGKFQVGKPTLCLLHERLLDDTPRGGCGGEETPLMTMSKLGTTVLTEGDGEQVTVVEVIVESTEEGEKADIW